LKNTPIVAGPSRSQICCNPSGSVHDAKLLLPGVKVAKAIPALLACCCAQWWPFSQTLIGYGK